MSRWSDFPSPVLVSDNFYFKSSSLLRPDLYHKLVLIGLYLVKMMVILGRKRYFSSVQLLSHVWLFATPWIGACQVSLSITNSRSLLKLMSIELVMPSNHLILCCPLLLLPSVFASIRVFSSGKTFPSESLHQVTKVLEFQLQHQSFQ